MTNAPEMTAQPATSTPDLPAPLANVATGALGLAPGSAPTFDAEKARAKARERWHRQKALRESHGHCSHCGRLHDGANGKRRCVKCVESQKKSRQKKRKSILEIGREEIQRLERRIGAMENYVANLRAFGRIEYKRGYVAGRRMHRKAHEAQSYREAMESKVAIGFECLQQLSHVYAR